MEKARPIRSTRCSRTALQAPACAITSIWRLPPPTRSTAGPAHGTAATTPRTRPVMCRLMWSATRTWTPTAPGVLIRPTATSGSRTGWQPAGRLTATGIGPGWTRGAGPGSMTRPGASPCPTTAAGPIWPAPGAGCPGPCAPRPGTHRPWWRLLEAATSRSPSPVATLARSPGSHWARVTCTSRRTRSAAAILKMSTAAIR